MTRSFFGRGVGSARHSSAVTEINPIAEALGITSSPVVLPEMAPPPTARPSQAGGLMAVGKYAALDPSRVDKRLTTILNAAAEGSPYMVEAFSGYRPGDPRFHGHGMATDIRLVDRETGKALPNYQDAKSFRAYEQFAQRARQIQADQFPDMEKQFRWGGYFSGPAGKYGATDLMHFDLGGSDKRGMAGGSWAGGLTKKQRAYLPGAESIGMEINMPGSSQSPHIPESVNRQPLATPQGHQPAPARFAPEIMPDTSQPTSPMLQWLQQNPQLDETQRAAVAREIERRQGDLDLPRSGSPLR